LTASKKVSELTLVYIQPVELSAGWIYCWWVKQV